MNQEDIKIGLSVIYWSVLVTEDEKYWPFLTEITSDWYLTTANVIVCNLKGKVGGFCISRLSKLTEESLHDARSKGLKS